MPISEFRGSIGDGVNFIEKKTEKATTVGNSGRGIEMQKQLEHLADPDLASSILNEKCNANRMTDCPEKGLKVCNCVTQTHQECSLWIWTVSQMRTDRTTGNEVTFTPLASIERNNNNKTSEMRWV